MGSGFFTRFQITPETTEAIGYLGILTVLGTAVAMILYYKLIQNTSPVFASTVTYFIPIVAIFWGVLDDEPLQSGHFIGMTLIVLGVFVANRWK